MADLANGSRCGGYIIVTKADVPMMFRVYNGVLQYSMDNGTTWVHA